MQVRTEENLFEAYEIIGEKLKENLRPILLLSISSSLTYKSPPSTAINTQQQQDLSKQTYAKHADIIYRCLKILKGRLQRHLPSIETIQFLDEICKEVTIQVRDERIIKPALYLRSALSKLANGRRKLTSSPAKELDDPLASNHEVQPNEGSSEEANISVAIPSQRLIPNFLVSRHRVSGAPKKKKTVALLFCDVFAGAIEVSIDAKGKKDVNYDDCFSCSDWPTLEQIHVVEDSKKQEVLEKRKELLVSPTAEEQPLFRFKYYLEQNTLDLPEQQLNLVFDKVTAPVSLFEEDKQEKEERMSALNIVVKIIMDQYCTGDPTAIEQVVSVLLEMLDSGSVETQTTAFDLILNLSVHAHLLEDIFPNISEELKQNHTESPLDDSGSLRVGVVQTDLFLKLKELILWIIQKRVTHSQVWESALNCFLYFTLADGIVDKTRLEFFFLLQGYLKLMLDFCLLA
jgi:hypothetical protein